MGVFAEWLKSIDSSRVGTQNIFCVTSSTTVKETFEVLYTNNILSCPVVDANRDAVGMVDLLDIVTFIVNSVGETKQEDYWNAHWETAQGSEAFSSTPVEKIIDLSGRNKLITLPHNSSLFDVCKALSEGAHRVWVTDEAGRLHRLITQTSLLSFISSLDNNAPLAAFDKLTIHDAGLLGHHQVLTVHANETVISAFKKMHTYGVSGLAVVDAQGALSTNLSPKDLRAMKTFNYYMFSNLFKTVREFISIVRQDDLKTRAPVITCQGNDTVSQVLRRLVAIRVHRLWVRDEHQHPVGVVSATDLLGFFVAH